MCTEFGCPPDVAVRQDAALTLRIRELRQYAQAKSVIDNATNEKQIESLSDWQREIVMETEKLVEQMET